MLRVVASLQPLHARSLLYATLAAAALGTAAPAMGSGNFVFEAVAVLGDAAPGTEPGTVFGPTPTIYIPVVPNLDSEGRVTFAAMLQGPAVTAANRSAVWTGTPGAIALVARAGSQVPGAPAGVTFRSFPEEFALITPSVGSGRYALQATLAGPGVDYTNDEGIWTGSGGSPVLLVREGNAAPGLAPGVVFGSNPAVEMSESGDALVTATVFGPGVTSATDQGFFSDRTGALGLLFREGDPAPDVAPGVVFGGAGQFIGTGYAFQSVQWNDASEQGVEASVLGPGIDTFNNEALFVERDGGLHLVAREDDDVPGHGPGVNFGGNSVTADFGMLTFNELGQSAFSARVGGGGVPTTYGLYSDHTGVLSQVAFPGDPAPGTGDAFGLLTDPVLSPAGRIAFRAALFSAGTYPPLGIWWDQTGAPGTLSRLVVPGDAVTDRPGVTIGTALAIVGFTAAGELVFRAQLDDPTAGEVLAILVADPAGAVRVVVAQGDLFDVRGDGGDRRAVSDLTFGSMNASGQMALRLDFADGAFGFYRVSPAQPTDVDPGFAGLRGGVLSAPNPFGSAVRFEFDMARPSRVGVDVFDVSGRLVARLLDEPRGAGRQQVTWNGRDRSGAQVASGVYWARVQTAAGVASVRFVRVPVR